MGLSSGSFLSENRFVTSPTSVGPMMRIEGITRITSRATRAVKNQWAAKNFKKLMIASPRGRSRRTEFIPFNRRSKSIPFKLQAERNELRSTAWPFWANGLYYDWGVAGVQVAQRSRHAPRAVAPFRARYRAKAADGT